MSQLLGCSLGLDVGGARLGVDRGPEADPGGCARGDHVAHQFLQSASVVAGNGVAVTCLVPCSRIGCLKVPVSTVAATEAIASGEAVNCPSPNASWASSEPLALAGALK